MSALIVILNVVVILDSLFLILLVVAQSNKGSDIGLFGGSAEMVFGSGQARAISRITITCALILMFGVFFIGFLKSFSSNRDRVDSSMNNALVVDENKTTSKEKKISSNEGTKGSVAPQTSKAQTPSSKPL